MHRPQLIGDEIHIDGQLVGIMLPHAAPGPRFDFIDFIADAICPDDDAKDDDVAQAIAEGRTDAMREFEEAVGEIQMVGGMVPMTAVQAAIREVKQDT